MGGLRWGVESICDVLTQHGVTIMTRWQTQRKILGARKLWPRLRRDGHDIARCTVERLMRELGNAGVVRGKRKRPVDSALRETRPADLVDRHFWRFRTDQLWIADFTYVWTWSGWVCVAFVFGAHTHRILGWRAAASMTTPLGLDRLDMALWTRRREGVIGFAGLTHHTDAGSVYTSIAFTDRLINERIDASVGSVGDAYAKSLGESQIGLYKSELIHHEGPWRDVDQVEAATASWALWFTTERAPTARSTTSPRSRSSSSTSLASNRSKEPADTSNSLSGHAGASRCPRSSSLTPCVCRARATAGCETGRPPCCAWRPNRGANCRWRAAGRRPRGRRTNQPWPGRRYRRRGLRSRRLQACRTPG